MQVKHVHNVATTIAWIPCELVILSRFISWKTHFLISAGSVFCKKTIRVANQIMARLTPPLIIFWQNTLPANIRKWVFSWNKMWRNYIYIFKSNGSMLHWTLETPMQVLANTPVTHSHTDAPPFIWQGVGEVTDPINCIRHLGETPKVIKGLNNSCPSLQEEKISLLYP